MFRQADRDKRLKTDRFQRGLTISQILKRILRPTYILYNYWSGTGSYSHDMLRRTNMRTIHGESQS
jgi:hypothetical protein